MSTDVEKQGIFKKLYATAEDAQGQSFVAVKKCLYYFALVVLVTFLSHSTIFVHRFCDNFFGTSQSAIDKAPAVPNLSYYDDGR